MAASDLTPAQCILLTVYLASESNIQALHSFTPTRLDALDPELVLRILLTYLPEALDPREYTNYVDEVASRLYLNVDRQEVDVNVAPVKDITPEQAERRVRKLHLLALLPPVFPPHAPPDVLTRFLCHRAYKIDAETGLLNLVPTLIEPFLERNDFLRTWYIAVVLPLFRMEMEYYPEEASVVMPLTDFEKLSGREGIDCLLKTSLQGVQKPETGGSAHKPRLGRDIKSLVGPWMYGHSERERRKADHKGTDDRTHSEADQTSISDVTRRMGKIALAGVSSVDKTGHDWEYLYQWMVSHSIDNFDLVAGAVEEWDGPSDIDLGGFDRGGIQYLDEELQTKLELQYAQAAFASCYAAQADTTHTVRNAHAILARLAELLDFVPPPDLATSVESLPHIERHAIKLEESQTVADLTPEKLLRPQHPLTTPRMETYMLLQMVVYSAYQFAGMDHSLSLVNVARLHFYATAEEQLELLRKILRGLTQSTTRKDDGQWKADRAKLIWLWNWGIEADDVDAVHGAGVLGKIDKESFQEEMLKTFLDTNMDDVDPVRNASPFGHNAKEDLDFPFAGTGSNYQLVISVYLSHQPVDPLPLRRMENAILAKAMEAYDGASNGSKSRGGVKKSNDIITSFKSYFQNSHGFQQATALIAATHSLSFYSLTLQHGVPFQPVNIRVSEDPLSLITKVLEQNQKSYTKLDDLISIAQNLVSAGLVKPEVETYSTSSSWGTEDVSIPQLKKNAERRVSFMAVEAALREDDFETAYSYIVNRLTPSGANVSGRDPQTRPQSRGHIKRSSLAKNTHEDDISWRAAFLAGRYRPSTASPPTLRRLEQRTELLSLSLLLAPVSALTEILAAWRRCEEETLALSASHQQAEQDFDDRADKRRSGAIASSPLPGHFALPGEQPALVLNQKRREVGRMGRGDDETPLSMFDLTRNAARAFSKNAFTAGDRNSTARGDDSPRPSGDVGERPWSPSDGQQKVRKRDMVANAVSGGLASGLGWVLGAKPANQQQQEQQ